MDCSTQGFSVHYIFQSLVKLMPIKLVMPPIHLVLSHLFSSCLQSFPASGSFLMCQLFTSGSQSIGASTSASVFPMTIQDWFPLGWTGWNSLQSKGLSRVFPNTTIQNHQFFSTQPSLWSNSHIHTWLLEKPYLWIYEPLLTMSLIFNMLSKLVIAFLPRSKCLLISWLQSPSAVILDLQSMGSERVGYNLVTKQQQYTKKVMNHFQTQLYI